MSEEILSAILRLLAIVASEDHVTSDERESIASFLKENLNDQTAESYLRYFDKLIQESYPGNEQSKIAEICAQINKEQTLQQKIITSLHLMTLIAADGQITDRERSLLYLISQYLHIEKKTIDLIKAFVIFQERSRISSGNILIIDNGKNDIPDRCRRLVRPNMTGFIIILRVPRVQIYLAKYIGDRNVLLNDAPFRPNNIYNLASGSSIRFEEDEPIYHSEIVNRFRQVSANDQITFVARKVTYKFKNGKVGLRNINIEEQTGRLVAIMGSSGSGKSTLLNVLNGNENPTEGRVRVNGVDVHLQKNKIEGVIGYVPQDDLLIAELSVFDNLYYAAKLCFKDMNDLELRELVDQTLESLGLYETRELKVGSTLDKTISGGQRKRLNIGLELLREPSVLFVDEPTSGLSSRDSENIMDLLKSLSLKGKLIFVVIHQPSADIFKMFDRLIVLDVGGYQIFYGNPIEGISYFKDIVKMVDQVQTPNPEQIFNIIETKVVNEFGNFTGERKITPYYWYRYFKERIKINPIKETDTPPQKTLYIPNKLKQLLIFASRDVKAKLNNKQYLIINLLEAPVLSAVLAFFIRYLPENAQEYHFSENLNIPVFFFISVIVSLFMGLTVSAEEIIKDRIILKRETFLNLSRMSYLLSKLLILFTLSAFQTAVYILMGSWILGIKGMFFPYWLVLFSLSCFANVLGLNISSAFRSAVTVYILIPLVIIPQLILSGVVVSFDKFNPVITAEDKVPLIGELMASRWAFEALAVYQFKENKYERNFYEHDKVMAQSEFKTVYLLPYLESDLEYVHHKIDGPTFEEHQQIKYKLKTIQNELSKELQKIGKDKFPQIDSLTMDLWNDHTYHEAALFLQKLKTYYNLQYKKANDGKQEILKKLTETPDKTKALTKLKYAYYNDAVGLIVKNLAAEHRIREHNNELIQKLYPIYHDPEFPENLVDFRAQFFQPSKHFAGAWIDTFIFNVIVIWSMTILLFIALYFKWFNKLISFLEK